MQTVLLTGASGKIGRGFCAEYLAHYRDQYALRLGMHDASKADPRFDDIAEIEIQDFESMLGACRGVDTVVHLAASPDWQAPFCEKLVGPNIDGAYNTFEAARQSGCRRVVYASSVHAVMGHPLDFQAHHDDPARPDTMYGVTKVFGESLCSSFAYLHGMSCIAVRIGAYVGDDESHRVASNANPQFLDIFVSQRDLAQLFHRCITAPDDVKYAIVHGVSDNRFKRMEIESTKALLGYNPLDDAFEWSDVVEFGPESKV